MNAFFAWFQLKPEKFEQLPRRARPPPRLMPYFLDHGRRGYLAPEVSPPIIGRINVFIMERFCVPKRYCLAVVSLCAVAPMPVLGKWQLEFLRFLFFAVATA